MKSKIYILNKNNIKKMSESKNKDEENIKYNRIMIYFMLRKYQFKCFWKNPVFSVPKEILL